MNPRGLGMYLRAINVKPKKLELTVRQLLDCGVKWAAIGAMWHEKGKVRWINKPENIIKITQALNEAGIEPYNWGYPWYSTVDQFIQDVETSLVYKLNNLVTRGFLVDPELGLRKHHREALNLFAGIRTIANEKNVHEAYGFTFGFTSYGNIVPDFPWEDFAEPNYFDPSKECDYGSPQLYESTTSEIITSLAAYNKLGFDELIPSYGLYVTYTTPEGKRAWRSKTPIELKRHFDAFVKAKPKFRGMIGWAENFIKPNLVPILKEWSELLDRGIFALKS